MDLDKEINKFNHKSMTNVDKKFEEMNEITVRSISELSAYRLYFRCKQMGKFSFVFVLLMFRFCFCFHEQIQMMFFIISKKFNIKMKTKCCIL